MNKGEVLRGNGRMVQLLQSQLSDKKKPCFVYGRLFGSNLGISGVNVPAVNHMKMLWKSQPKYWVDGQVDCPWFTIVFQCLMEDYVGRKEQKFSNFFLIG